MNDPVAVIDLGTNTFHLLIATGFNEGFKVLFKRTDAVKLGEGGIEKGMIAPEPFDRGIRMLEEYAVCCREHGVKRIRAIATSAVRSAGNGELFCDAARSSAGIEIEIVDGNTEAAFIYAGVRASGCLPGEQSLIVDIGGGSVEFIICNRQNISWKQSFEIGAARLLHKYGRPDPLSELSLKDLKEELTNRLAPLFEAARNYKIGFLAGSAGAFETFAEMEGKEFNDDDVMYSFDIKRLTGTFAWLCGSTYEERAAHPGIIPLRVDMIVYAALISDLVISKLGITNVNMTTWSLKEGVMAGELLSQFRSSR